MTSAADKQLRQFFQKHLLKVSVEFEKRGKKLLPPNPDPDQSSYYVVRQHKVMSQADFEQGGCATPQELEAGLRTLWERQGLPELEGLAAKIAKLAAELRPTQEQADSVDPFVYVMY